MTYPPGAEAIGVAARRIFDRGWLADGSVFSEDRAIWTPSHLEELHQYYVLPARRMAATFLDSLQLQLVPVSEGGRQLVAELLYVNVLPIDITGRAKRSLITSVLGWAGVTAAIPSDLNEALDRGVFNGGIGFNLGRWRQLMLLIETVRAFKRHDPVERQRLLADPWAFRDFVRSIDDPAEPAQRNALLFLAFPDQFPPVVIDDDRRRIVAALGDEIRDPTGDVDRDLASIRSALEVKSSGAVDFYHPPWDRRWRAPAEKEPGANAGTDPRAWLVRGSNVRGRDLAGGRFRVVLHETDGHPGLLGLG